MKTVNARDATGIIDPVTNMLREGYAVLDVNENKVPILEAYFKPHETELYEYG